MRINGSSPLRHSHHEGMGFSLPIHKRPVPPARRVVGLKSKKLATKDASQPATPTAAR